MNTTNNLVGESRRNTAIVVVLLLGVVGCDEQPRSADSGPVDSDVHDVDVDVADGDGDGGTADADIEDAEADIESDVELWPEPWEFHEALGDVEDIPEDLQPLFVSFGVPELPEPGPDDWLSYYDEPGETFDEYVRSRPNLPTESRNILYIQPLGESADFTLPTLEQLEVFYEAYFSMDAQILEPINPDEYDITERAHPTQGQRQLLTTDVLDLLIGRISEDAYSLIAVTTIDLYPADDWNYVFGQASLVNRVGVFSFARYDNYDPVRTIRRSFKVLAHEAGHMFGILHCIHFHCLMNGANHLLELDLSPIHLCPVDLRKLYWAIDFDPVERYERLIEVYESLELYDEAQWIEDRLRLSGF